MTEHADARDNLRSVVATGTADHLSRNTLEAVGILAICDAIDHLAETIERSERRLVDSRPSYRAQDMADSGLGMRAAHARAAEAALDRKEAGPWPSDAACRECGEPATVRSRTLQGLVYRCAKHSILNLEIHGIPLWSESKFKEGTQHGQQ